MTTTTIGGNGRLPRKSLNDQIEKLDGILDMMAEAIPQVIADSVRQAVGDAVRQAVEASIREALANPTLLRAALARHEPAVISTQSTAAQPESKPRRTLKDLLRSARGCVGSTMTKTAAKVMGVLSSAWTRSLRALRNGYAGLFDSGKCVVSIAKNLPGTLIALGAGLWRYRRTSSAALTVGVACGIGGYLAGPTIANVANGIAGAALTAAGMALLERGPRPSAHSGRSIPVSQTTGEGGSQPVRHHRSC